MGNALVVALQQDVRNVKPIIVVLNVQLVITCLMMDLVLDVKQDAKDAKIVSTANSLTEVILYHLSTMDLFQELSNHAKVLVEHAINKLIIA